MQIEAIYDQGKLEFVSPIKLKLGRIRLLVQIADADVIAEPSPSNKPSYELPAEVRALALEMEAKLDRVRHAPLPDEKDLPLSQKKLERIEALTLRDEIRSLR
ncbi:MAG: hypothetical protein ACFCUG_03730 [Thiotrichales bacterium]